MRLFGGKWLEKLPERERPTPVVIALGCLLLGCLFVATVLGVGKRGALWEPARVHFMTPAIAVMGMLFLREATRGDRSWVMRAAHSRSRRLGTRATLWMFGLMWPFLILDLLGWR